MRVYTDFARNEIKPPPEPNLYIGLVVPRNLTANGLIYDLTLHNDTKAVTVYKGHNPYFDGIRSAIDKHGFDLTDKVSFYTEFFGYSRVIPMSELYGWHVTERKRDGLKLHRWHPGSAEPPEELQNE